VIVASSTHVLWMHHAIALARHSPRSATAYSVGSVIVDSMGLEITHGYSRDIDPHVHAEESALTRAANDPRLRSATIYSTLEPCTKRRNKTRRTCTELIISAGIPRVVIAWREPDLFVTCEGVALLTAAGIEVVELPELAYLAQEPNEHLGL
jgi:diaminohydroxyphosphoribosylaminopyrimidine deaminase/5-amino-6-(5-phosphoribosylamino)uracil reductase